MDEIKRRKIIFKIGLTLLIAGILLFLFLVIMEVLANYEYNNEILYNWNLADKSSTLTAKSEYITLFLNKLENTKLAEYNAIWLKTPDNNVQNNIKTLRTLKDRLNEIKDLDPESFAYQTAIQQITAQEQGEASAMMGIISGGWYLKNYPYLWNWMSFLSLFISFSLITGGIIMIYWGRHY